ncbi:MAG TPA: hypothetical protein VNZ52_00840, partial [Candidatus Thermoplasmatota archaeon]|nr:hypothetical protein [Candidatus Thermoplasmatota archaeon]
ETDLPVQGGTAEVGRAPEPLSIPMLDDAFRPREVWVVAGTAVTFRNAGGATHGLDASDGSWVSPDLPPGATFTRTFTEPGEHRVVCRAHGRSHDMQAVVHVVRP